MLMYAVTFPLSSTCLWCNILSSADTWIDGHYLHAFVSVCFPLAILACLLRQARHMDKVMSDCLNHSL